MNPFKTIKYQLYLFQLENYNTRRFLRLVLRRFKSHAPARKNLVWTPKLIVLFIMAILLAFCVAALISGFIFNPAVFFFTFMVSAYIFSLFFFVFLVLANILVYPIDVFLKTLIVNRARRKISKFSNLQVIAIAGSYGKTTMKEALAAILGEKYRVLKTPENINTPLGVARLILKEDLENFDIFIVEMGAYEQGDVKALCETSRPDIAVLTGINEAHLERFGSLKNTIAAKFEIVENAKPDALVLLNEDNELIRENYKKYVKERKVKFYDSKTPPPLIPPTRGGNAEGKFPSLDGRGEGGIKLLGEYAKGIVNAAIIIAKDLGLTDTEISAGIKRIKAVPHRLQPILNKQSNILVIDDSYSGNPDGVREAIKVLNTFKNRRKIYITPGLVEMGDKSREVHLEIGRQLAGVADIVILIKNSVTPHIEEGLNSVIARSGATKQPQMDKGIASPPWRIAMTKRPEVIWFNSTQAAHAALGRILKSGDVILFQNDWPENYL